MNIMDLSNILPEIWLISMISFILLFDLFLSEDNKWITYLVCQITLIGLIYFVVQQVGEPSNSVFFNMFVRDDFGNLLKLLLAIIGIFVFMYSKRFILERRQYHGEYFVLCLFSLFGMYILISAANFLSLYLGIELLALPLYALITISKEDNESPEAAMKYFVMGALASGLLLYGISLLYGVTGTLDLHEISKALSLQPQDPHPALLFGLVFTVVGLAFKFGAVPFHLWLPDVYQGAPISVTLFIGTLPKLAAFGFAIRLLVTTFAPFNVHWQLLMMGMAILSLGIGNIVAILQTNLKRLLGYSTIAHVGFVFLGILAGPEAGFSAAFNYVVIYSLMALGVLGMMTAFSYQGFEAEHIHDFKGLGVRHPWLAFLMMILMLSLSGIPPFAGFYAKLFVLNALMTAGYTWLAVIAVLLTVVGAYYYLKVIRVMFFDAAAGSDLFGIIPKPGVAILSLNGLAILVLGLFPMPLFNLCTSVLQLLK